MTSHSADPFAAIRHLDGQMVKVAKRVPTEDVDGMPLGVDTVEVATGTLCLPVLPAALDNEGEDR